MAYPTGTDLAGYLIATGLVSEPDADTAHYNDVMAAVALDWEKDTGWIPFLTPDLGEEETEERTFDGAEGYRLFPSVGILTLDTLTISGTSYTVDEHFYLSHRFKGGPWMAIDFSFYVSGYRQSIVIAGTFGFQATLDKAVERALLMRGAREVLDSAMTTGELRKETVGPVTYEYDTSAARDRMTSVYDDAVKRYKRPSL
jgi:hypothetical protein